MRCFTKVLTVSWCLCLASQFGAPTANAADGGREASSAKVSSVRLATQPEEISPAQQTAADRYGDLPLSFEANQGQADSQVKFLSRGSGYSFFLTQTGAVLSFSRDSHLDAAVLQMQLAGAGPNARVQGVDELPGKSNYFLGSDSRRWRTGVPTFSKVAYQDVYPGINLVYYGNQHQLEYDFVVAPGADPRQIRLSVSGAQKITVDAQGNLVLRSAAGDVQLLAPKVYQEIQGQQRQIAGQWNLESQDVAGFRLGAYDHSQALIIDPILMYSSFLGGSQKNVLSKIAIDAAGNAYVAGYTASGDFPAAPTPQAMTFGGGARSRGAFVAKIDPSGSNLLYSTYLSGSADEEATGLAVDKSGNVFVAGNTHSIDFPTRNAFQSTCATHTQAGTCSSAFLAKISPTGDSLLFSTYLGGSGGESARSLAVDASGAAYVAGITSSADFPSTTGAAQARCAGACEQSAFVAKFDPSGATLAYATYLGGSGVDDAAALAVDATGNVYVAGHTTSADFPLATPFQKACTVDATSSSKACVDTAFVTKIKSDFSAFSFSTYLGGNLGSKASAIAVDSLGSAYVTGSTQSSDFPVLKAFQKSCGLDAASRECSVDVFLTKFAPSGKALVYSTYLGGSALDEATGIAVDATGNAHVIGSTRSSDFPTLKGIQSQLKGVTDAFVARFNSTGSALTFSTYHGGSGTESGNGVALDAKGNIYVTGETSSTDFPTQHPFQSSCAGACASAFITKMTAPLAPGATASTTVLTSDTNPSVFGQSVTFTATVSGSAGTPTGTVDFKDGATLLGTGTLDATGTATFSTSALSAASHSITGVYSGDGTYATSTSAVVTQVVNAASTTTAVTAVPASPSKYGESVAFTATVSAVAPGAGTPVGSVDFTQGGTAIAGCTGVALTAGAAVCNTSALAAGAHTIKGTYVPTGGDFTASNGTLAYTVNAASTTTTLTAVPAGSASPGQSVTFTATVAVVAPGAGTPVGTVDFADSGTAITGCTGVAVNGGGVATCTTSTLATGAHTIKGTYTPTGSNFTTSNDTLPYTITAASTTTTVTAVPASPSTYGQSVTFTATVAVVPPGTGTPDGTVAFSQAGTNIAGCGAAAVNGSGVATCTTSTLAAGPHTIKGTYTPTSGNFATSNGTLPYAVNAASTTTAVSAAPVSPSTYGESVTFSATVAVVAPGAGTPDGTVAFSQGGTTLTGCGAAPVNGSGVATCTISTLAAASYTIKGTYTSTSGNFTTSNGTLPYTVNVAATTTTVTANPANSVPLGQSVTFTATVAAVAPGVGPPVGSVDFAASGTAIAGCTGAALNAAGKATCTTSTLAAGGYTIKGTYNPTGGNFTGSNDTLPYAVVAPPTLAKAFNATTITLGATSTLTFTINNPPANTVALTGVAFTDTLPAGLTVATGTSSPICGGTLTTTAPSTISLSGATVAVNTSCGLPVTVTGAVGGLYSNTVSGAGVITSTNGGPGVASNTANLTVQDYLFSATDTTAVFIQGSTVPAAASATVTPQFTYAGTVSSGGCAPSGLFTCTFNNTTSGNVAVSITAAATTPVGPYPTITLSSTDNSTPHIVHSAAPFSLFVECTYSLGDSTLSGTVPAYTPGAPQGDAYSLFVTEVAGGSNCPWGPSANAGFVPNVTATSGISIVTGSTGQVSAPGTSSPVTYSLASPIASGTTVPQIDKITVSYFQAGQTNNVGTSNFNVVQEAPVTATSNVGVTSSSTMVVTASTDGDLNNQAGSNLSFALVQGLSSAATPTVCSAVAVQTDGSVVPDPANMNYGFSCAQPSSVPLTGSQVSFSLQITVPASASALSAPGPERRRPILFYAFLLGLPAIVFVSTGTFAFGSQRQRLGLKRLTSAAGILLILGLLVLLPACGGGFQANFGGTKTASYSLTVMGYAADGSNAVQGAEIFTVPLTILK